MNPDPHYNVCGVIGHPWKWKPLFIANDKKLTASFHVCFSIGPTLVLRKVKLVNEMNILIYKSYVKFWRRVYQ